jgi:hypothetical protein
MARGFLYLVVVMDWVSRYILAWRLSNLLDASFCTTSLAQNRWTRERRDVLTEKAATAVAAAFASGGSAQDPGQPGLTRHRP